MHLKRPKPHNIPDRDLVMAELNRARSRLGTICRHAEREGEAYPGQYDDLRQYLHRLRDTIDTSIARLEAAKRIIAPSRAQQELEERKADDARWWEAFKGHLDQADREE